MDRALNTLAGRLLERTVDMIRARYPAVKRLVIIPNRELNQLPLHAVPLGTKRRLLDDYDVLYAPSATAFQHWSMREGREGQAIWPPHLLAIDNPDRSLKFSTWEVDEVAKKCASARVLRHEQARAGQVLGALDADAVHFSCHGRFDSRDPRNSRLALAGGTVLNLHDILNLRLPRGPFVVLSACETALTDDADVADEFEGLHMAFLIAGARTAVGSLWSVNDFSTSLLLAKLYEHRANGNGLVSEALGSAQRWLRDLTPATAHGIVNRMGKEGIGEREVAAAHRLIDTFSENGDPPFRHPFWWAAFQTVGGANS